MNITKAIVYGIVLYALMLLSALILAKGLKVSGDALSASIVAAGAVFTTILSFEFKLKNKIEGLLTGIIWLIVINLFVYCFSIPLFRNWDLSVDIISALIGSVLVVLIAGLVGSRAENSN
jgi:hypothetical protein